MAAPMSIKGGDALSGSTAGDASGEQNFANSSMGPVYNAGSGISIGTILTFAAAALVGLWIWTKANRH